MPVSKDHAEQIVAEDLKRKYPNVEGIEFILFELRGNVIALVGEFKVKDKDKMFAYVLDAQTGEIKMYFIEP
jgi:hypothetical protein